jgi:hypothetical protein
VHLESSCSLFLLCRWELDEDWHLTWHVTSEPQRARLASLPSGPDGYSSSQKRSRYKLVRVKNPRAPDASNKHHPNRLEVWMPSARRIGLHFVSDLVEP